MSSTERVRAFDEAALTEWMHDHLEVVIGPLGDRDELGRLDTRVLKVLDPPLYLQGMGTTPIRQKRTALRGMVTRST